MPTYYEEMKAKHPDRPMITRPTWELKNMARALRIHSWNNTEEETQRLADTEAELKARRSRKKPAFF